MEPPPPYEAVSSSPAFPPRIPTNHEAVPLKMPSAPPMDEDRQEDGQDDRNSNVFVHEPTTIEVDPRLTRRGDSTTVGGAICLLLLMIILAVIFFSNVFKKQ